MTHITPISIDQLANNPLRNWHTIFTPIVERLVQQDLAEVQLTTPIDSAAEPVTLHHELSSELLNDIDRKVFIRDLGNNLDWQALFDQKLQFTEARNTHTLDQILVLEHNPVFTQGLSGKPEHILGTRQDIPIVHTDRGGQITYHGPRQLIVYFLIDFTRKREAFATKAQAFYSRTIVSALEFGVIHTLKALGVSNAYAKPDAPGIYIEGKKVSSLGLKIKRKGTYHGIAINLDMDLSPFHLINPCGYAGLEMCNVKDYCSNYLDEEFSLDKIQSTQSDLELIVNNLKVTDLNNYLKELQIPRLNYTLLREFVKTYFVTFVARSLGYQQLLDYPAYNFEQ